MKRFEVNHEQIKPDELYQLTLADYNCIFQRELNYSSVDINPYYLYSIQTANENYIGITILHFKEALYTSLYLLTYNKYGEKISEVQVAIKGGDGSWWFNEKSELIDSKILNSKYQASEMIEENEQEEIWETKRILTQYSINEIGEIRAIKIDNSRVKHTSN